MELRPSIEPSPSGMNANLASTKGRFQNFEHYITDVFGFLSNHLQYGNKAISCTSSPNGKSTTCTIKDDYRVSLDAKWTDFTMEIFILIYGQLCSKE